MPNQPVLAYSDLPQMGQGALSGWMRGMNAQTSEDQQVANRRDQDLSYDRLKNLYNQEMIQTPVMAAQANNSLSAAQNETADWQSGKNAQLSSAKKDTELADYVSKKSSAELVKMQNQGQVYLAAEQMASPTQSGPADLAGVDNGKWQGIRQMAKAAGLPDDLFPEQWTPEVQSKLHQGAQIAVQTAPYIQKMNEIHAQTTSHENIAKGNNAATVEAARLSSAGSWDKTLLGMDPAKQIEARIQLKEASGQPLDESDITQLKAATRERIKLEAGPGIEKEKDRNIEQFYADKKAREKAAAGVGLPADSTPPQIAGKIADQQLETKVQQAVYARLDGKKISIGGETGTVKDGKFIAGGQDTGQQSPLKSAGGTRGPVVGPSPAAQEAGLVGTPAPTAPGGPVIPTDPQRTAGGAIGGPPSSSAPPVMPKSEADVVAGQVYVGKGGKLYKKDDAGWHEVKP